MWEAEAAENRADAGGREMKSVDGVSKDIFSQKFFKATLTPSHIFTSQNAPIHELTRICTIPESHCVQHQS